MFLYRDKNKREDSEIENIVQLLDMALKVHANQGN